MRRPARLPRSASSRGAKRQTETSPARNQFSEQVTNWVFAFTYQGGRNRLMYFVFVSLIAWLTMAFVFHNPFQSQEPVYLAVFHSLIARDVIRHFLVMGLGLWLALLVAGLYLDDIYELDDVGVTRQYINWAAFGGEYNHITIRDGSIAPEYRKSPIARIGGPGRVNVHLENAALFELSNGAPDVVGPTVRGMHILHGFERLRRVIDLRDQVIELTVEGRTQDGIRVTAKDVKLVYSILRKPSDNPPLPGFQQPYAYNKMAIQDMVYNLGRGQSGEAMRNLIRSSLRQFIAERTLNEFLTNANNSELAPREQLSNLFMDFAKDFSRRAAGRGVQLTWIGVGTWVTPSEIIPARNLEAWKLSCQAQALETPNQLQKALEVGRVGEALTLIGEVPAVFYALQRQNVPDRARLRALLKVYREKLHTAREQFLAVHQPVPLDLEAAYLHLQRLSARWLGGDYMGGDYEYEGGEPPGWEEGTFQSEDVGEEQPAEDTFDFDETEEEEEQEEIKYEDVDNPDELFPDESTEEDENGDF
jgi:hypothetical protein